MLDGQDRCMKDTTIEQLRKHLKTPRIQVFHEGKPPNGVDYRLWAIEHYSFMLRNAFSNHQGGVIIYNRSHLGEVVWGPKYRGYDADFIFELERQYLSYVEDAYLIVLTDTAERLMARDDGKSLTKSTQELDEVRSMFSSALDRSCIQNKLHVKLEEVAFDDVFPTVWSFINAKSK
jgi:thymidylate kinase